MSPQTPRTAFVMAKGLPGVGRDVVGHSFARRVPVVGHGVHPFLPSPSVAPHVPLPPSPLVPPARRPPITARTTPA
jgi:hypothetical protein